ncbi:MAG: hypothetical protein IPJ65_05665 [Archangiaceae bacterium]|nr:hypothetical protein [Archangiaceae bacterium]
MAAASLVTLMPACGSGGGGTGGGSGGSSGGTAGGSSGGASGGLAGGTAGGSSGGASGGHAGGTAGGATGGGTAGGSTGGGSAGGGSGGGGFPSDGGVPVTFMSTCPTFTACGGDPNPVNPTNWRFTGVCIDDALFAQITNALNTACQSTGGTVVSNKRGRLGGSVSLAGANVTRDVAGFVTFDTSTPSCSAQCGTINLGLGTFGLTGSCAASGTDCKCTDLTYQLRATGTDPYVVDGGTLEIQTASRNRSYAFCIQNGAAPTFTYRETSAQMGTFLPDPGTFSMTR